MHKFKIGDKVRVVDEEAMVKHFVDRDAIKEGTVEFVHADGCVQLQEATTDWWYPENCLDFVQKFDPKPGGTIVCNNGMTFTACEVEDYKYLDYYPNSKITTEIKEPGHGHMCWDNFDGKAKSDSYSIKEIIPASVPAPIPEPKTYTVREVFNAIKEAYNMTRATDAEVAIVQKILDRRDDPDYTTYLDLKKRFETKD